MSKNLLFKAWTVLSVLGFTTSVAVAQTNVTIDQGGTVSVCSGNFYDSGGPTGSYSNSENHSILFTSGLYGLDVELAFNAFQLESCCDFLGIYDGPDANAPQLYFGNGSNSPGTVQSTSGMLFVQFTSDGSVTFSGWDASIGCLGTPVPDEASMTGINLPSACGTSRFPIEVTVQNGGTNDLAGLTVNYRINGGSVVSESISDTIFSGQPYTYMFQQMANLAAAGTYNIESWVSITGDPDNSNDTAMTSISFQSPMVNVYDTVFCETGNTLSMVATGGNAYIWYGELSGNQFLDTTDSFAPVVTSDTSYTVYFADSVFYVDSLSTTGAIVDHNSLTGDDRGGIAVTDQYIFINGDGNIARYDVATLTNGISLPRRDGIFSDLSTGVLYTLSNSGSGLPVGTSITSYTVDEIVVMDNMMALQNAIPLSQSITMGGGYANTSQAGIYAGYGYVILYTGTQGNNWYKIDLPSGTVSLINTFSFTGKRGNENWTHWGFAGFKNGSYHVTYRANGNNNIEELNIDNQTTSVVRAFSNLSDMASITYSPWLNRMYYHHESSSQFGSGSEMGGYIEGNSLFGLGPASGCPATIIASISQTEADLGSDTTFCDGNSVMLDPGSFQGYQWSPGGATTPTLSATTTGTYSVTATDEFGCDRIDDIDITVTPLPMIDLGADTAICEGEVLQLDAAAGRDSYMWNNNSTDQTRTIVSAGTYSVTVEENNCFASDDVSVTVNPLPAVSIGPDTVVGAGTILTFDAGAGYSSYDWSTTDTTRTTSFTAFYDTYVTVQVTDANGCTATDQLLVSVLLSNGNLSGVLENIQVYPNPANEQANLSVTLAKNAQGSITLTDLSGKVVYSEEQAWSAGNQVIDVPLQNISSGVYFLNILIDNESAGNVKLIKR